MLRSLFSNSHSRLRRTVRRSNLIDSLEARVLLTGDLAFAYSVGSDNDDAEVTADSGQDIATDDEGNIYVTGYFEATADFDPGANSAELVSSGDRE